MEKLRNLALILFVAVFITACGAGGGGTNVTVSDVGNVEGTVTGASSSVALSGVTVQIGDKTAPTGTNGVYSITDLAVGSRTITATKSGYQDYNGTVTVTKGTTVIQNIQMILAGTSDTTPPTVSSVDPASNATDVAVNKVITVTFSEAMDCSTITTSFITLKDNLNAPVTGTISSCNSATAVFTPSSNLSYSTLYTATITTGVKDSAGNVMAAPHTWTFTTGAASASSGSLDSTFGTGGKVTTAIGSGSGANAVGIQPDGKIVAVGVSYNNAGYNDFALVRYNTDGTLDSTFGTGGKVTTDFGTSSFVMGASAIAFQPDGRIVVAGGSNNDFALAMYNTDGTLDSTFGTGGKVTTDFGSANDRATAVGIQSDGKIVAAGSGNSDFALVRYNTNGTLDSTFGTGGKVTTAIGSGSAQANSLAIQPDGKIVAAAVLYNGSTGFALVRYNTDGLLDATFGTGGKAIGTSSYDLVGSLGIQSDGKIVAAGASWNGGLGVFALVRYNTDGTLDTIFGTGGKVTTAIGSSSDATKLGIQSDGKIVVAGSSNNGSNYDFAVVRYNTDGTLDTTFGTSGKVTTDIGSSTGDNAYGLGIQPDGKIVVAGPSYNGSNSHFAVVRYLP